MDDLLPLSNGKAIAVGFFDHFNGAVANGIVRLTAAGAVDATFNSGLGAAPGDDIERIIALPNGQFLATASISSYDGVACSGGIIRLNADGSLDPTFVAGLGGVVDNVVLQPDGRILVAGQLSVGTSTPDIARLMPNGAYDASFTPPSFPVFSVSSRYGDALQLQPDGKVIVLNIFPAAGGSASSVVRLNVNGTLDSSFQVGTAANNGPSSVLLLASGKMLLMGGFTAFSGVLDRPLVQLTSAGAVDPTFQPLIQTTGSVAAAVRQADGKLMVGGSFTQINGQTVRRLARFNTDGTVDASFTVSPGLDTRVADVALQPDGRVLTIQAGEVHRYLTTGQSDNSFSPPSFTRSQLTHLLLQADGRVLVGGTVVNNNGTPVPQGVLRLLDTGAIDASFAPASTGAGQFAGFQAMAQQPDGKLLVAGRFAATAGASPVQTVVRLTSTGALDAGFTGSAFGAVATTGTSSIQTLAVQPDGKILAGGAFSAYGTTPLVNIARLNPDGTPDAGFTPPATAGTVNTLQLQPNNRILVGGAFTSASLPTNLARLLPTGTADTSFGPTAVPNSGVNALVVQPDGKIVLGGSFASLSNQASMGVARLTATNVLQVKAPQAVADRTSAWPVPAHSMLNVSFDVAARPQSLDLLDAVGRTVLHQSLNGQPTATLAVDKLTTGTYLLRVGYESGVVVRRIQVQ
ncbi:T9SS type A sorting domain-containing protein [Hymenobacter terricola]|uniref:T9SS type A sorting domain-containing protein n=1 Tax=Hymenobacter terricola TaxID=2819236 RepID=UPI001B310858|nr:T9SS type A sorting domain-containing protein [Hymenobacter terricola]